MSKQLWISVITAAMFFLFLFICQTGFSSQKSIKQPVSKQVGMYLYRCNDVMGYDSFDALGQPKRKVIIKRDESGNMIERTRYDGAEKLVTRFIYEIDDRGLMLRKIRYGPDEKISWYSRYHYNEDGILEEQKNYTAKDIPIKSNRYYFNNRGKRIRKESFGATGKLTGIYLYIFDSNHHRIRDYSISETGTIKKSTKYIYGASNNIESIQYMNESGLLGKTTKITYNTMGYRTEKKSFGEKGALKSTTKYHYNKVFLDGRPINDRLSHYGGVHFDLVTLENIATIEIIRGKGALQYGDDASAGVILITTPKMIGHGGNLKGWLGNGNTHHIQTNAHLQRGNLHSGLTLSYDNTDGFVTNDDHLKKQAGLRSDYSLAEGRLGLTLDFAQERYGLPGRVEFPSPNYHKEKEMYAVSVPIKFKELTSNTFYNNSRQENRDPHREIDTFMKVREAGQDITNNHKNNLGTWKYGGNLRWGEATSSGFSTQDEYSLSVFGQHSYTLTRIPLTSTIGLRLNTYSEFSTTVNPELKLGWKENDWAVSISYSRAHNAPSFYQRYDRTPTKNPNPDLEMEISDNFSFDWSLQYLKPLTLSGSLFYNPLTDKISYVLNDSGVGQYEISVRWYAKALNFN